MRNRKLLMKAASGAMAFVMAASVAPMTVLADEGYTGWKEENGNKYWYENDVKQGLEGRGKEIYDPASDAWYWLDSIDQGKMATSKDVYQESLAGEWGDIPGENGERYGKWVRYDENGHMIKGWSTNQDGTYYFDLTYGTMAKGETVIDGIPCVFDSATGIGVNQQWVEKDGIKYWYEGGKRQGYDPNNADYRGKEIYDPASDAWYWLDNVDQGKMATSKDVYQESEAGQWADRADGTGKWVRYDENGHMIKGWSTNENGKYYFDPIYGTMAKGNATIDGVTYYFDENTGVCQGEVDARTYYTWKLEKRTEYNADGSVDTSSVYTYDSEGDELSYTYKSDTYESVTIYDSQGREAENTTVSKYSGTPSYNRTVYNYDGDSKYASKSVDYSATNGKDWTVSTVTVYTRNAKGSVLTAKIYSGSEDAANLSTAYEYKYNDNNEKTEYIFYDYPDGQAVVSYRTSYEYDGQGNLVKETSYGSSDVKSSERTYTYDGNGNKTEQVYNSYNYNGSVSYSYSNKYEYDANGNCVKEIDYDMSGKTTRWTEKTYQNIYGGSYYSITSSFTYDAEGIVRNGYEYIYDGTSRERYNSYTQNKVLDYYTIYDTSSFPEPEAGAVFKETNYTYDGADNSPISKEVYEYKCFVYTR